MSCEPLRELMKDELEKTFQQGFEIGRKNVQIPALKSLMEYLDISMPQAMDLLKIPDEDRKYYMDLEIFSAQGLLTKETKSSLQSL